MKRILLFYYCLFPFLLKSQTTSFQKVINSNKYSAACSVHQNTDGGYILMGFINQSGGIQNDAYVIRTDSNGNILWSKYYDNGSDDSGLFITQTQDGNFVFTGSFTTAGAYSNACLIKIDGNGNLIWTRNYGFGYADRAVSIAETPTGGFMLVGSRDSASPGSGTEEVYVLKTDSSGNLLWAKVIGGIYGDIAHCIKRTSDDNYIIAAETASFGAGMFDGYAIKIDSTGTILWTKTIGDTNQDRFYSVAEASNGDLIFAGYSTRPPYIPKMLLHRTDPNGSPLLSKIISSDRNLYVEDIKSTIDGGFISAGYADSAGYKSGFLLKTDSNLNIMWAKKIKPNANYSYFYAVEQTTDRGYVLAGKGIDIPSSTVAPYLIKTDSIGLSGCDENDLIVSDSVIILTTTTPASLSGTSPVTVSFTPLNVAAASLPFTTPCTTEQIIEENKQIVTCFPNPSYDQINFKGLPPKSKIEIFDILGNSIYQIAVSSNVFTINLEDKVKGIYFYRILNNKQVIKQGKIVLQ